MKIERFQRGQIIVENVRMFSVRLGGKSPAMNALQGCIRLDKLSKIIFEGRATISKELSFVVIKEVQ